ncbi:hypothetical protein BB559_006671, partial [Furculomyces boomerangus]
MDDKTYVKADFKQLFNLEHYSEIPGIGVRNRFKTIGIENFSKNQIEQVPTSFPTTNRVNEHHLTTTTIVGAATFIFRKFIFGSKDNSSSISQKTLKNSNNSQNVSGSSKSAIDVERNIAEQMKLKNKNVVLAFGSQTGTAEDLAKRVSRELQQDFGARTMVIDPEDFEIETLSRIQPNSILVLLMSTTGEGEPTDNMTGWYDKLIGIDNLHSVDFSEAEMIEFEEPEPNEFESDPDYTFDYDNPLANLHFAAFGLGNTTYEHFNSHVKQVSKRLQSLGATLVGEIGLGDDDMDIDEDFENWEAANLPLIGKHIGSTPQSDEDAVTGYHPDTIITEVHEKVDDQKLSLIGSLRPPNNLEVDENSKPKVDAKNPWESTVLDAWQLCSDDNERQIIHMEIDLSEAGIEYTTGDHLCVYPTNYESQVDLLLKLFNLKSDQLITIAPNPGSSSPLLASTILSTYGAALRHYLDIITPIPRDTIKQVLMRQVKSEVAIEYLKSLMEDRELYNKVVVETTMTPGELIESIIALEQKSMVPEEQKMTLDFSMLTDLLPRLAPRFYSISSSNLVSPNKLTITVVVLRYKSTNNIDRFGIASNYLGEITNILNKVDVSGMPGEPSYKIRNVNISEDEKKTVKIPIYVQKAIFRLPSKPKTPVIMVGPGTGIAPFRGFVQERAYLVKQGKEVGPTILFFGNRHETKDFLYKDEMKELFDVLGSQNEESKLFTAFSRDQEQKIYVQHRILENAKSIYELLMNRGAYFYICGDGKFMVKDVEKALVQVISEQGGMSSEAANAWLSDFRKSDKYQED